MRISCPAQGRGDRENKSLRENRRVKKFAVAGHHAVVCYLTYSYCSYDKTLTTVVTFTEPRTYYISIAYLRSLGVTYTCRLRLTKPASKVI